MEEYITDDLLVIILIYLDTAVILYTLRLLNRQYLISRIQKYVDIYTTAEEYDFLKYTKNLKTFTDIEIGKYANIKKIKVHNRCYLNTPSTLLQQQRHFLNDMPEITHLELGNLISDKLYNLPDSLTHLSLGNFFNDPIAYPRNLKKIVFGVAYTRPIDDLPSTLTHLTLDSFFNERIDRLPSTLKYLKLGYYFNRPIDNLPDSIETLITGSVFNRKINRFPSNLKHLTLGFKYDQSLSNLPQTLESLHIKSNCVINLGKLPRNLKKIEFGYWFNQCIYDLPSSVEHLIFGFSFNRHLYNLPPNLKILELGASFSCHINLNKMPSSLSDIVIKNTKNCKIIGITNRVNIIFR